MNCKPRDSNSQAKMTSMPSKIHAFTICPGGKAYSKFSEGGYALHFIVTFAQVVMMKTVLLILMMILEVKLIPIHLKKIPVSLSATSNIPPTSNQPAIQANQQSSLHRTNQLPSLPRANQQPSLPHANQQHRSLANQTNNLYPVSDPCSVSATAFQEPALPSYLPFSTSPINLAFSDSPNNLAFSDSPDDLAFDQSPINYFADSPPPLPPPMPPLSQVRTQIRPTNYQSTHNNDMHTIHSKLYHLETLMTAMLETQSEIGLG